MSNTSTPKFKLTLAEMVTRGAFLAFLMSVVMFMLTNLDMLRETSPTIVMGFPSNIWEYILKVSGYTIVTALTILLGISHPGITRLIKGIQDALRDGKITPEEKLGLIMLAKDEFLGAWADLSALVTQKKETAVPPPEPLPEGGKK